MFAVRHSRGHRTRHRLGTLFVAVSVLVGVAACTFDDPEPAPARTVVEQVWTAAGIDPVSAVKNVGGVAVVYGTTPDGLLIYGLDPRTGAVLWSKPAVPPSADSTNVRVGEVEGVVQYFRPTGTDRLTQSVLADPKTGADRSVSAARYWSVQPASCPTDRTSVCLSSFVQSDNGRWNARTFRVDQATGETNPVNTEAASMPEGGYPLPVADMYYSYDDNEMTSVGRWVDGATLWSRAAGEMFGADLPQPSYFSTWNPQGRDYAVITALGSAADQHAAGHLDLSKQVVTSVFSLDDGSTRWTRAGWIGCGDDPSLTSDRQQAAGVRDEYLCQYTGSATRDTEAANGLITFTTSDLTVTLERIDPATGQARWSADLGDAKVLASDSTGGQSARLDDTHVFEPNSAGGLVIDLNSGETRAPQPDDSFWCDVDGTFSRTEPYYQESTAVRTVQVSGVVRPCRASGEDAPMSRTSIPSSISASFDGDLRAVALSDGVAGILAPPAATDLETTAANPADTPAPSPTESEAPATASAQPVLRSVEQTWATTGFEAKTTPTLIGGTAVLYGAVGSDLFLIGLDPATGGERWRRKVNTVAFSPSREVRVTEIDGMVAYLRSTDPGRNWLSEIVLMDPTTGIDMVATDLRWWYEFPEICSDDTAFLCARAYYVNLDNTMSTPRYRIDRVSGAVTQIPVEEPGAAAPYTTLWEDVVLINGAPVETIGVVKDGTVVWSRPVAEIAGPGATLDHDWYLGEDGGATPVIQLSVRIGWTSDGTSYPALDLATNQVMIGINRDDGTVVWSQPGTWSMCRGRLADARLVSTPGSADPALRCRYSGRLDSEPPGRSYGLTVPSDLTVTLERVDLQTGQAVWSVPLDAERSLATDANGQTVTYLDDHRLLLAGQVVDLDTGSSRPPAAGENFWCPAPQSFTQADEWTGTDGRASYDKRVEGEVFVCDAGANPTTAIPAAVPLAVSAATDDGLRLVSTPTGVIAYRVPL